MSTRAITRYATLAAVSMACLLTAAAPAAGQAAASADAATAAITQIDSAGLLARQGVRLYVAGIKGGAGPGSVRVQESADGLGWEDRPVEAVTGAANADAGVTFYFLLDDSGSMWPDDAAGDAGADEAGSRIGQAKDAARRFIARLGPADRLGLAVFNTRYWRAAEPTADHEAALAAIDEIARPSRDDAFTELYQSIDRAVLELAAYPGRKAVVVLSDGENYPYTAKTGEPSPEFGDAAVAPAGAAERAVAEGVTCYAVRFGPDRDPDIGAMAERTGGAVFDAADGLELAEVYATIRSDLLEEAAVDYRAGMAPGDRRYVRVSLDGGASWSASRYYYVGAVFGQARAAPGWFDLAPIFLAAAVWLAFWLLKLERPIDRAGVSLLYGPRGAKTEVYALSGARTVIGGSADADITLAGNPAMAADHATILFDEVRGEYTIAADAELRVNNRPVKRKRLEPGDVIDMAGTVVVFDEPTKGK